MKNRLSLYVTPKTFKESFSHTLTDTTSTKVFTNRLKVSGMSISLVSKFEISFNIIIFLHSFQRKCGFAFKRTKTLYFSQNVLTSKVLCTL